MAKKAKDFVINASTQRPAKGPSSEFDRFKSLARGLINVSKEQFDPKRKTGA